MRVRGRIACLGLLMLCGLAEGADLRSMVGNFSEVENSTVEAARQIPINTSDHNEAQRQAIAFITNPRVAADLGASIVSQFGVTEEFLRPLEVPAMIVGAAEALRSDRLRLRYSANFLQSKNGPNLRGTASVGRIGLSLNPEATLELSGSYAVGGKSTISARAVASGIDRAVKPRFMFDVKMIKQLEGAWRLSASARADVASDCERPSASMILDLYNSMSGLGTALNYIYDATNDSRRFMLNVRGKFDPQVKPR